MTHTHDQMSEIVGRIVDQIEAGASDWAMPWRSMAAGWPTNALTTNRYTGGNVLAFAFTGMERGYTSSRWATYKQWQELGAHVRKGERGTCGFKYGVIPGDTRTDTDPSTGATVELQSRDRPFLRSFHVFNAAQVDDDPAPDPVHVLEPLERDAFAEVWFGNVPAAIAWGAGNPCYQLARDRVVMPEFDAFHTATDAYATLAHELGHWTGHSTRLAREYGKRFGDHAYAAEELVAELSAAFTCATVGIDTVARDDHASYLGHWLAMLRETPALLWSVASKAQAATDHLASYQRGEIGGWSEFEAAS
jgi:antirestriction protein ArdC